MKIRSECFYSILPIIIESTKSPNINQFCIQGGPLYAYATTTVPTETPDFKAFHGHFHWMLLALIPITKLASPEINKIILSQIGISNTKSYGK